MSSRAEDPRGLNRSPNFQQNEEYQMNPRSLQLGALLLGLFLCSVSSAGEMPLVFQGDVHFSVASGSIFVAVDGYGEKGSPDGVADRLFTLQREPGAAFPGELPGEATDALVYFDTRQLVVSSPVLSADVILTINPEADAKVNHPLGLDPFGQEARQVMKPRARTPATVYAGVGLIYQVGVGQGLDDSLQRMEVRATDLADAVSGGAKFCPDGAGGGNVDCFAGGCGAAQCTGNCNITPSCTVSCASGYFACCNCDLHGTGCKCYSNSECGC